MMMMVMIIITSIEGGSSQNTKSANEQVPSPKKGQPQGYKIRGEVVLPQPERSKTRIEVRGSSGSYATLIREDGTFQILDLPAGIYQMGIYSPNYVFERYRIICSKGTISIKQDMNGGIIGTAVSHPLTIRPIGMPPMFEARASFDFMGLVKSPMFLLIGGFVVMMFFMPKLMDANKRVMEELKEDDVELPGLMKMFMPSAPKKIPVPDTASLPSHRTPHLLRKLKSE